MICTTIDEPFVQRGSGVPRSSGPGIVHASTIIHYIETKVGRGYKGKGFEDFALAGEVGFLWEDLLSLVLRDRMAIRIGEVVLDGITCSPDGLGPDVEGYPEPVVLEEYKCTWKSSRHPIDSQWYYMQQLKTYCKAVGVKVAVMRVLYLMGNYKGSGPQYRVFRFTFDQQEIDETWAMLVAHRDEVIEARRLLDAKTKSKSSTT